MLTIVIGYISLGLAVLTASISLTRAIRAGLAEAAKVTVRISGEDVEIAAGESRGRIREKIEKALGR